MIEPTNTTNPKNTPRHNSSQHSSWFRPTYLQPKYWGIWLGFMLVYPLLWLPMKWQFWLGKQAGVLIFHLGKRRRQDTLTNLALCFSDKSKDERFALARQVYINAGIGLFESLLAWHRPQVFARKVTISGLHHLTQAQQEGKGVLLLGAHYTLLDLGGLLCKTFFPASIVYRPQNNALLEALIHHGRAHIFAQQISYRSAKAMVRTLTQGKVLWYTPDQDFGLKHGVMAPFFNVPAATITTPRRIARMAGASVLAVHFYRQDTPLNTPEAKAKKRAHYHITITPELQNYPSNDELADAIKVNELLEGLIRIAPSQYMWFHRRFKTQADGSNPYAR